MENNIISVEDKKNLVVGFKQVLKAKKAGVCAKIFVAVDSSPAMLNSLTSDLNGAEIVRVPSMRELGEACGIDVPSSCAAVIRL